MVTIQEAKPVPDAIFLPLEVQYIILDYVFLKYHHSNAAYRFIPPEDVLKIFLVCRTWYGHAKKLFYSEVYFFKPLKYYRFATSLLQGPPKGMGKDLARLVRKVIFEVPREENVFRSIIASKVRFASIPRAIEAILRCTPLITWVEIRGCYPGGLETGAVAKVLRDHSKALRVTYNANAGLIPYPLRPTSYNDPAQLCDGTWVNLQSAPGSFQNISLSRTLGFEYDHIFNMQNLQRLDLSLELSSATFAAPGSHDHTWYIAVSLSQVVISILNIEVHFRDWCLYELEHYLAQSGTETFFALIAQNPHLKRLEIISLQIPPRFGCWPPAKRESWRYQPPESTLFQGRAAARRAEDYLKTWIESDPTGRLRNIVALGRKVVDTVFPTTPTGFYPGVDMPPYGICRGWYDRFTRQYRKAGNLDRFKLSEHEEHEVAGELEKYKFLYCQ